ncbi:hypothetical protein [Candidatus Magnetominusculus xianensis]|uniref:Secreted protein n=1 Tax=Candidatus Magnetominusculus xianensis TaxID=1748249 RepID=A0ABR5SH40_9BACT|nr:hypothetical protein [Candidatus Magnetominusculus xianensis]KWT90996.1 hypothetical protein ASN18_1080 [Candidatus Magnetominusculus xianensis]MBF0403150.1 hypothetical protein [Nitrospirota bacterium]
MKRSIVYLMIAAVVLTGLFMWGGNQARVYATLGDNVTYTFPFLATHSDKPTYCVVSNLTNDNATIGFQMTSDSAYYTTSATQNANLVSTTAYVYRYQTRQISFAGNSIQLDGSAIGTIPTSIGSTAIYGGMLNLTAQAGGTYNGDSSAMYGAALSPNWSCAQLPIACFQGTTSPKRNLVGYVCSDENTRRSVGGATLNNGDRLSAAAVLTPGFPYQKIYTY